MHQTAIVETTKERLARHGYTLIMSFLVFINLCVELVKLPFKDAVYAKRKRQRFGYLEALPAKGGLLVHCVSVGEVVVASSLIKRIRKAKPDYPVTITTTTATGAEQVKNIFADTVTHLYLPYDLPSFVNRLVKKLQPVKVLVTEVELWPNFIHACHKENIPVYLINARMTDKSANNYAKLSVMFNAMLKKITAVCAQGQRDYDNYLRLGMDKQRLYLSNNIKFDLELTTQDSESASDLSSLLEINNRAILLGASTHDPEESALLKSYRALKQEHPTLLLILTPRHPQRFAKVAKLIQQSDLKFQCLSEQASLQRDTDVLLIDAMGVLKSVYSLATIAFVGGSLADRGGHNALEAALLSKPILMGPSRYNNPAICDALIKAGAMQTIENESELTAKIRYWLDNTKEAQEAGRAGAAVISENAGAINRTMEVIGFDVNQSAHN